MADKTSPKPSPKPALKRVQKQQSRKKQASPQTWAGLAKVLKEDSIQRVKDWTNSDLLEPSFSALLKECWEPRQKKFGSKGHQGPDKDRVIALIRDDETSGSLKYTNFVKINKDGWSVGDHFAHFVEVTADVNSRHKNGILFGKEFSKDEKRACMWYTLKYLLSRRAPSKQKKQLTVPRPDKSGHGILPPPPMALHPMVDHAEAPTLSSHTTPQLPSRDSDGDDDNVYGEDYEMDDIDESGAPEVDETWTETSGVSNEHKRAGRSFAESEHNVMHDVTYSTYSQNLPSGSAQETISALPSSSQLPSTISTSDKMKQVGEPEKADVDEVLEGFVVPAIDEAVLSNEDPRVYRLLDTQSFAWFREISSAIGGDEGEGERLGAVEITQQDIDESKANEFWTTTPDTERPDSTHAQKKLGLSGSRSTIEGMSLSTKLEPWQGPGIQGLMDFQKTMTGGILADHMGMGKTVMMLGHILAVSTYFLWTL